MKRTASISISITVNNPNFTLFSDNARPDNTHHIEINRDSKTLPFTLEFHISFTVIRINISQIMHKPIIYDFGFLQITEDIVIEEQTKHSKPKSVTENSLYSIQQ